MERGQVECGAIFVIAEGGTEAERCESGFPLEGAFGYDQFALGAFFVAPARVPAFIRGRLVRRSFGCEDHSFAAIGRGVVTRRSLNAQAQEHATAAEVGLRSVVESVLFEETALGLSTQGADFAQDCGNVRDAEFDFDFAVGFSGLAHAVSIEQSRRAVGYVDRLRADAAEKTGGQGAGAAA